MNVLYITHKPVYPKIDGGCVAMANFLDCLLMGNHEVKQLTISTDKHPFDIADFPIDVKAKTHPEHIYLKTDISAFGALLGVIKKGSYHVNRFYSKEMEQLIIGCLTNEKFDFVILESLFTTPYLEAIRSVFTGKVFYRAHNVEYKIWNKISNGTSNLLKRAFLKKLTKDLEQYERLLIHKVDAILTLSKDDEYFFKANTTAVIVDIPFSLKVKEVNDNDYSGKDIFHLGDLNWKPNLEAVERLIRLFPKAKQNANDLRLHIIGHTDNALTKTNENDFFIEGFVDDFESRCLSIGILVTPILSGSGIRIKILEMMNLGVPVITTAVGAQGIDYQTSKCLVVVNTDEELIEAICDLHQNKEHRKEIGSNGFDYIHQHHNIINASKQLSELLHST